MNGKKDDDEKIIYFPELDKRKNLKKEKKKSEKHVAKHISKKRSTQDALEEQYRTQYRAERAKEQGQNAQYSASGKKPFINWHKIPIFTRISIGTLLIVQLIMSFALSSADRISALYYFGFVPAMYTGDIEWSWSALIAPFTTLILHSGWMHLTFNIVMLMAMGVFFEREFGAKRTAIFFLACGMAGNLTYLLLNPGSPIPVVGASGAISGLFAVTFMIMIERGMVGPEVQKRGPLPFILLWSTIIIGLGVISSDTAWQSHIGGFWGGIGLFHLWKKGVIRL
ncbi:MAG: rhomboid family intramembrane serine protease [Zetaproteobacteria bacterium]|nr:MAG: rhomboid family intramembrane serine protease [Zetaproteobacteria bacterium]